MNWPLLLNSIVVGGVTTVLSCGLGFVMALTLVTAKTGMRRGLLFLSIVALVLPPFLVVNTWLDLFGQAGLLRPWLPLNLYSRGGAILLLSLLTWPIPALFVSTAWTRLERAQLESDTALRGAALIRWLLWPMARRPLAQAAVLTFVLALNNFAIPVILQVPVFPEELWLAFTTRLNDAGAWAAAWPLIVAPLIVLFVLRKPAISWPHAEGAVAGKALRQQLGVGWRLGSGVITSMLVMLSVALPMAQLLFSHRTWDELPNVFRAAPNVVWNSFAYAALTAAASIIAGLLTWRFSIGALIWIPFLIPGVLLGRAMVFTFGGTMIYGTFALALLAFALRYLAPGWSGVAVALRSVDRELNEAGRLNGARAWSLLRHVQWPQIAAPTAAAWYVTYLLCLWDVETLVLIYPPGGETLALRIFNLLHYGHHPQVNALCVILLGVATAPLVGWNVWVWMRRCWRNG
jgi:iron(III) transport system permease protein